MASKTFISTKSQLLSLKQQCKSAKFRKTPPYALYSMEIDSCVITAYESGKLLIQGNDIEEVIDLLQLSNLSTNEKSTTSTTNLSNIFPSAGSDEVGTGDYFGPVVVVATCVEKDDVNFIKSLHVQDSKQIDDEMILKIGPQLMERLTYSLLIVSNDKYNQMHDEFNMVKLKVFLHNQAFYHLQNKRGSLPTLCVVDQFVQEKSYYRYLQYEQNIIEHLHFETKAENKYLAVACASIIARYAFLKYFDQMCNKYNFTFLKGAGFNVDKNIMEFVKIFGEEELKHVAKLHFNNTQKALHHQIHI